jgi:hypothetical protein
MKRFFFLVTILLITATTQQTKAQVADFNTQLCHNWTISAVELYGAEVPAEGANAGDKLNINADKTIDMILNGHGYAGTYRVSEDGTWMSISLSETTAMRLKILELTDTKLKVDHIEDNIHYVLVFTHL